MNKSTTAQDFNLIEKELDSAIYDVVDRGIADEIRNVMVGNAKSPTDYNNMGVVGALVYKGYTPSRYKRRTINGGLADRKNVVTQTTELVGEMGGVDGYVVRAQNVTEDNGYDYQFGFTPSENLIDTIEQGIGYDVAGGINEMPQGPMSIHQVTYFELVQHPHNLDVIIADGLVAKGYNASTTKRGLKG